MNNFIYNNSKLRDFRKELRNEQTEAEKILWSKLRNNQIGYKFRRQYSIGAFIADFYCPKKRLVIELDGSQHIDNIEYDKERTKYFNSLNIDVLRFWNNEVFDNLEGVMEKILRILE